MLEKKFTEVSSSKD